MVWPLRVLSECELGVVCIPHMHYPALTVTQLPPATEGAQCHLTRCTGAACAEPMLLGRRGEDLGAC